MANYDVMVDLDFNDMYLATLTMKKVQRAVERGVEKGVEELAIRMKEKMIEFMGEYTLKDGDTLASSRLAQTINILPQATGIKIEVGGEYATFVEYGTGIVGSRNPHPMPDGWVYDPKGYGEDGWSYIKENGKVGWTAGQSSKPFVYRTWFWARGSVHNIVMKHVRREVRKVRGVR